MRRKVLLASLFSFTINFPIFANNDSALDQTSDIKESPEETSAIEVIQVTAQKREQAINEVAISISVINGNELLNRQLKDTTALSSVSPNFKITQNAAEGTPPAVNIRGVGSIDYNTSTTSPVGVYTDGVASGSANAQLVNLYDVESVQVLRGPQGTLFGRNTTGGAVLITSRKPQFETSGYIDASVAERDTIALQGAFNFALNDEVAFRLAASHQDFEYSTNNLFELAPEAGLRQSNIRFSALGNFDQWEVIARLHATEWDGVVNPSGSIGVVASFDPNTGLPATLCTPGQARDGLCTDAFGFNDGSDDFFDVSVNNNINNNSPHETSARGINLQNTYRFSDETYFVSLTSFDKLDRIHFFNSDASPASLGEGGQDVFTDTFTQEFRLHHETEKAYIIGGLYYLRDSVRQANFFDLFRDFRASEALFSNAATFFYNNQIDTDSYSAFANVDYKLTEKTSISAGIRYTDETTDYRAVGQINVALAANDQQGLTVPGWDISGDVSDDDISGKIAINHQYSDSLSYFVSFARGFKSGGYNGALITTEEEALRNDYGAENLNAYEVGLRKNWNNRVNLYASAFFYDYQNQQVFMNQSAIEAGAPPLQLLTNVGESEIYGAELEINAALTSNLTTRLSVGYLPEANLEEFFDAAGNAVRDNRLPFTSEYNVSGQADYRVSLNQADLTFHVNFDYQSDFFFDQNQNPFTSQGDFTLWNARISYETNRWGVSAWVKNLTDEEYSNLLFDLANLFGSLQDFKGEGRQLGVGVNYVF